MTIVGYNSVAKEHDFDRLNAGFCVFFFEFVFWFRSSAMIIYIGLSLFILFVVILLRRSPDLSKTKLQDEYDFIIGNRKYT
jgi:hypothetical protein